MEKITEDIVNIGVNDRDITLFEGQYEVEKGMAYNSYVILDEQVVVMDTVDPHVTAEWLKNMDEALGSRKVDYLVIQHMEPDHGGSIMQLIERFPDVKLVGNAKTFQMFQQFFGASSDDRAVIVKEGDTLSIGKHTLQFFMAPMVHWPEVMVTYEQSEKVLFSADGFGKFGTRDADEDWTCEARRYYINICGKYGMQVQALLKKAAGLEIDVICPLHGPVLTENLKYYIDKYQIWSSYEPEDEGVLIACASIYGHTMMAAEKMKEILEQKGAKKVVIADLARDDLHEAVEDAFRYSHLVLAAASYDASVFPPMEDFLHRLKAKNYQKRTVGIIENGSWAPTAAKSMKALMEGMKAVTFVETVVTIKSALNSENLSQLETLADELLNA
ncbi:MAG: FprA family A-type flavoprotein [Lachnospiraceae bacterium]|nr:FprA family A-type flavoprotein [Lachnospiraceae bacterium]MDE6991534.1 FprA family A-type flavoprotein [Lachnospiraceae bacterium]MDE6998758.1 FprA family A-type flavoprotein [Lachnospiraceae bacterium]